MMFGVRVRDEEVSVNLTGLAVVVVARMDVLKRRQQKSQQNRQAALDGDRTTHRLHRTGAAPAPEHSGGLSEFKLKTHLHSPRGQSRYCVAEKRRCDDPDVRHVVDVVQHIERTQRRGERLRMLARSG